MNVAHLVTAALLFQARPAPPPETLAPAPPAEAELAALARQAVEGEGEAARRAQRALRAAGPAGLQALLAEGSSTPQWHAAVDAVAAQRDADASGLYWYTGFQEALAAAQASGRPILSLRLLGRLDEELSCANSRFFRTVLYPDAAVSRALRERFVLHWQSERPVPRVTVDMGDGRRLQGTITGNSIHYVLDARGRVVDALPGLYGPQAFLRVLGRAEQTARQVVALDGDAWTSRVARRHRQAGAALTAAFEGSTTAPARLRPTAAEAAPIARTKAVAELPVLRALSRETTFAPPQEVRLARLADRLASEARLDSRSRALLKRKHEAMARAYGMPPPDPARALALFERSLAEDTAFNEYVLHQRLHGWFADRQVSPGLEPLNARVYAELFLTPAADPWLGLVSPDTYAALEPRP
jgi:hypothetical protein